MPNYECNISYITIATMLYKKRKCRLQIVGVGLVFPPLYFVLLLQHAYCAAWEVTSKCILLVGFNICSNLSICDSAPSKYIDLH